MNSQLQRTLRVIQSFSGKKEFFQGKPIWNPGQNKDNQQKTVSDQEKTPTSKTMYKQSNKVLEFKHGLFLQASGKQVDASNLLQLKEKLTQLKSQPDSSQKFGNLIQTASEMNVDYEQYFKEAQAALKQFDPFVYNSYFKAVAMSSKSSNIKQKELSEIIKNNHKYLDNKCLVMYYDLIFRTSKLPVEKTRDLLQLLLLIKRHSIKISTFDLSNFCYILNFELYNRYPENFDQCAKVVSEYVEYVCSQEPSPKFIPNLSVIFSICRDVSEKLKTNYEHDPCLKILRSLVSVGVKVDNCVGTQELANWSRQYLKYEQGIQILMEILRNVEDPTFGVHFQRAMKRLDETGAVFKCLDRLVQSYQSLKSPSSLACLEVLCLLAERSREFRVVADIFMMSGCLLSYQIKIEVSQYSKNQTKSLIIYQCTMSMVLQQQCQSYVETIQQLVLRSTKDGVQIPRLQQDLFSIKALIKESKYEQAFISFKTQVINETLIEFQRKRIREFLNTYLQAQAQETEREVDIKAKQRITSFCNSISPAVLLKLYAEDASDNTVLEAISFSEDPWDFWEEMQRYQQFEFLRNAVLKQTFNYKLLLNIKLDSSYWGRKRYVLENYEHYMDVEKQYRIRFRREERLREVMQQMMQKYVDQFEEVEDFKAKVEEDLGDMLNQEIFGKEEDEFPEYESMVRMRNLIHTEEEHMGVNIRNTIQETETGSIQQLEQSVSLNPQQEQKTLDDAPFDRYFEDENEPFPTLDTPSIKKRFIQLFYEPGESDEAFGDFSMNPKQGSRGYLSKFMTLQQLEEMRLRYYDAYRQTQATTQCAPAPAATEVEIWSLVEWGVRCDEPMAVKLGEFYSQHVGLNAPANVAKLVASYYKYQSRTPSTLSKFDEAHSVIGPVDSSRAYSSSDSVFARPLDYEILQNMECSFEHKAHARALLKTTYSLQKYQRYGVTHEDVLRSIKRRQQTDYNYQQNQQQSQ